MQSTTWYWHRLRAMSPEEVRWRLRARVQDTFDYCLAPLRRRGTSLARIAMGNGQATVFNASVFGDRFPAVGGPSSDPVYADAWRTALIDRADRLLENRYTFFDLRDESLGQPIDWNRDCSLKRPAPLRFSAWLDYRDASLTGDAKLVWEPNRHHHLVVLGRAYRVGGDERYARKVVEDIHSWIDQCPYGLGMNWRSPLELAIRLINWVAAIELISPSSCVSLSFRERVLAVANRHIWEIARKYSRCSSANNHLVGEAAGVFVASCYFSSLRQADDWRRQSKEILLREMQSQVLSDGGHCELAPGYHLFVLQFFLLAGLAARDVGDDWPVEYWDRLESMFEFVASLSEGGDRIPMFGDCDDGYVIDLAANSFDPTEMLCVGSILFDRSDFKEQCQGFRESAYWLFGQEGMRTFNGVESDKQGASLQSRALPASGYYLLQHGQADRRISLTMDCAALGFGTLAAHGHADALNITLRVAGSDILVDPGTFDYFTHPEWRNHFRSTAAHNTIVVDGVDQSKMCGAFLWGERAEARCVSWDPTPAGGVVTGEHDGYTRLDDPVVHRRRVSLDGQRGEVVIRDELLASGHHHLTMHLHFGEDCEVKRGEGHTLHVVCGQVAATLKIDSRLTIELVRGCYESKLGWVSRRYHHKRPSTTLAASGEWSGEMAMETRLALVWGGDGQTMEDGKEPAAVRDV